MLLPPRRHKPRWKQPFGQDLAWETSTVEGRHSGSARETRWKAQVDVHVLGKRVTAIAPPQEALLWAVIAQGPMRSGPAEIDLKPGDGPGKCPPTEYSGCQFEIAPSLQNAGIRSRWVCDLGDEYFSVKGYEIEAADGRRGYLMEVVSGGNTALVLMYSKARLLEYCTPGIQRH